MKRFLTISLILTSCLMLAACKDENSREVGQVDTAFQLFGPNHKVITKAFEDPKVSGVSCFVSAAETGGFWGGLGLKEDTSDASIACVQTGPVTFIGPLKQSERVFEESRSLIFKELRVVRNYDPASNTLVYLSYSTRLISGSPQNSVSAVPVKPWPAGEAPKPPMKE